MTWLWQVLFTLFCTALGLHTMASSRSPEKVEKIVAANERNPLTRTNPRLVARAYRVGGIALVTLGLWTLIASAIGGTLSWATVIVSFVVVAMAVTVAAIKLRLV